MLRILQRLLGTEHKAEAHAAVADAQQSIDAAEARTPEIKRLVRRVEVHGIRNHFGERYEELARRIVPTPEVGK